MRHCCARCEWWDPGMFIFLPHGETNEAFFFFFFAVGRGHWDFAAEPLSWPPSSLEIPSAEAVAATSPSSSRGKREGIKREGINASSQPKSRRLAGLTENRSFPGRVEKRGRGKKSQGLGVGPSLVVT